MENKHQKKKKNNNNPKPEPSFIQKAFISNQGSFCRGASLNSPRRDHVSNKETSFKRYLPPISFLKTPEKCFLEMNPSDQAGPTEL